IWLPRTCRVWVYGCMGVPEPPARARAPSRARPETPNAGSGFEPSALCPPGRHTRTHTPTHPHTHTPTHPGSLLDREVHDSPELLGPEARRIVQHLHHHREGRLHVRGLFLQDVTRRLVH